MIRRDRASEDFTRDTTRKSRACKELKSIAPYAIRSYVPADIVAKLIVLGVVLLFSFSAPAADQEGYHGHRHDQWHTQFYSGLMRPDTKTSCCNLADSRPTEIRSTSDHYQIKEDGQWIPVPIDKIVKVTAPDGGAHICASPSESTPWDQHYIFCVVMPLEM